VLGLHSEACALAGRTAAALDLVEEAARLADEGSWDSASLKIQKADLLLSCGETDRAETLLAQACDEAGRAGARMIQLRAATRLARLAATSGRRGGLEPLPTLYATFTEGLETPDLLEARAVLARE
jgi:hypothetical protein